MKPAFPNKQRGITRCFSIFHALERPFPLLEMAFFFYFTYIDFGIRHGYNIIKQGGHDEYPTKIAKGAIQMNEKVVNAVCLAGLAGMGGSMGCLYAGLFAVNPVAGILVGAMVLPGLALSAAMDGKEGE